MGSRIRPSNLVRVLGCPGSYAFCKDAVDNDNPFALEGRTAHKLAELCFLQDCDASPDRFPSIVDEESGTEVMIQQEMCDKVNGYVNTVRAMAEGSKILPEVHFTSMPGGLEGTGDAVILNVDGQVQVHDLKYGRKPVQAENNPQLLEYGCGALDMAKMIYGDEIVGVKLVIHQPNLNIVDEWDVDRETLEGFEEIVEESICRIVKGDWTELRPGEKQCAWCPKKALCPELAEKIKKTIVGEFGNMTKETIIEASRKSAGLSPEDLAKNYGLIALIQKWCDATQAHVYSRLNAGEDVPGLKLVEGRAGARYFTDEELAIKKMKSRKMKKSEMYTQKLISPTQLEKAIGKDKIVAFADLINRKPAKPAVVPVSDKRPALVTKAVKEEFEDLTTENREEEK